MTREERHIAVLNRMLESMDVYDSIQPSTERKKAIKAAIKALSQEPTYYPPCIDCNKKMDEIRRAYDKLKEQEPCTYAVSIEALLDETIRKNSIWNSITNSEGKNLEEIIFELPPVNPQPSKHYINRVHAMGYREGYKDAQKQKSGKWIKSRDSYGNNHFTCPFCGHDIATKAENWDDNYCSNCGARMEGVEYEKGYTL